VIVVAWQGADHADPVITRDKAAAKARVDQLLARVRGGEAFEAVAATDSDAPSSKIRGGVMGTFAKDEWPDLHMSLRDTVFALKVNELAAAAVEAPYGYVIARRCPVEKAHGAHILIRYTGAKRAPEEMKRTMEEARTIANDVYQKVIVPGADFAALAKKYSEDGSGETGGDIGSPGRGRLAVPFEQTLFSLPIGMTSGVVESEYGFHIIKRLPNE
jgi:parvulin-like peptidyl-prolyl isomerase